MAARARTGGLIVSKRPALEAPVEISRRWKSSRDRKNSLVLAFKTYEGHTFLDCRIFGTNAEGQTVPTAKGITIGTPLLSQFVRDVQKAHAKAIELGLIDDDGASE
jgi:Transcriptional Coactivator p15 (PC4)